MEPKCLLSLIVVAEKATTKATGETIMSQEKIKTSEIITLHSDKEITLQCLERELQKKFASQPEDEQAVRFVDEIEPFSKEFLAACRK